MISSIVCYHFFLLFVIRHLCFYLYYCLFYVYPYSLSITLFFLYPSHPFLHSYLQIYIYARTYTLYHSCSYPIILYHILLYPILSYPILSYPIMLYHILLFSIICYPILSYLVPNTSSNLVLSQFFRLTSMP